jgi:hypothetical protein
MLDLSERIYDPELGEGVSSTEYIFEKYYKSKNPEDYFISFTAIDKLGINPRSKYETPIGIYTYPVEEFFNQYVGFSGPDKLTDKEFKIGHFAPFAGQHPHVWVVKVNRNAGKFIEDYDNYSQKEYDNDVKFIMEEYKNKIDYIIRKSINDVDNHHYSLFNNLVNFSTKYADAYSLSKAIESNEVSDRELEDLTEKVIEYWAEEARHYKIKLGRMWNITREFSGRDPVKWNKLWRNMGYIGVTDRSGFGFIHPNEKIQALFFLTKAFTVVDKVQNIEASIKPEEVDNLTIVRKALSSKIDKFFKKIDRYFDLYEEFIKELKRFFSSLKKFFEVYNVPKKMKNIKGELVINKYYTFRSVFTNFFERLSEAYAYDKHPFLKFISVYVEYYLSEEKLLEYDFIYDSYVKFVDDMEDYYGE